MDLMSYLDCHGLGKVLGSHIVSLFNDINNDLTPDEDALGFEEPLISLKIRCEDLTEFKIDPLTHESQI